MIVLYVYTTSFDVSGVPSDHLTPCFSLIVTVLPSVEYCGASAASSGLESPVAAS